MILFLNNKDVKHDVDRHVTSFRVNSAKPRQLHKPIEIQLELENLFDSKAIKNVEREMVLRKESRRKVKFKPFNAEERRKTNKFDYSARYTVDKVDFMKTYKKKTAVKCK